MTVREPDLEQAAGDDVFFPEIGDEALEAAGATAASGAPTLMHNSYCFTCPDDRA